MKPDIFAKMKKMGKQQWILLLLVGVLLVCIVIPTGKKTATQKTKKQTVTLADTDWDSYRQSLEEQLKELLGNVEGVGKVQVMVTLADHGETIVEKDVPQTQETVEESDSTGGQRSTKQSSWQETTVYIEQDGEQVPYVIKEKVPDIAGICVICEGGANGTVAKNISEAVQALFSVEVHKIKVMKMR